MIHRQITTKKNTLFLIFVYSWQQTDQNVTNSIKSLEVRKFLSTRFNFNPNSETCTDIKLTGQWSSWDILLTFSRPFTGSGAYGVCKQRCSVYRSCCFHFCCYMSHQRLLQASDGLSLTHCCTESHISKAIPINSLPPQKELWVMISLWPYQHHILMKHRWKALLKEFSITERLQHRKTDLFLEYY